MHYAREGAKAVAIVYKDSQENQDAKETVWLNGCTHICKPVIPCV